MPTNLPQYLRLYRQLKAEIRAGTYRPGDLLPSEHTLSRAHGVTRPTIRQGLEELVKEGYIRKVRGKGSIVQTPPQSAGIGILNVKGTTDSVAAGQLRTVVVSPPRHSPWPEDLPYPLSATDRSAGCVALARVRHVSDVPVFYEETFLPDRDLPGLTATDLNDRSLFGYLADNHDLRVTGGDQRIRARPADTRIAGLLSVPAATPVVRLDKRYRTNRSDYDFYTFIWCDTRTYYLEGAL